MKRFAPGSQRVSVPGRSVVPASLVDADTNMTADGNEDAVENDILEPHAPAQQFALRRRRSDSADRRPLPDNRHCGPRVAQCPNPPLAGVRPGVSGSSPEPVKIVAPSPRPSGQELPRVLSLTVAYRSVPQQLGRASRISLDVGVLSDRPRKRSRSIGGLMPVADDEKGPSGAYTSVSTLHNARTERCPAPAPRTSGAETLRCHGLSWLRGIDAVRHALRCASQPGEPILQDLASSCLRARRAGRVERVEDSAAVRAAERRLSSARQRRTRRGKSGDKVRFAGPIPALRFGQEPPRCWPTMQVKIVILVWQPDLEDRPSSSARSRSKRLREFPLPPRGTRSLPGANPSRPGAWPPDPRGSRRSISRMPGFAQAHPGVRGPGCRQMTSERLADAAKTTHYMSENCSRSSDAAICLCLFH